jgi:uncharacterized protein
MKVWIDCSNSPHPLLFAPVARRLEAEGHKVTVTAREHAQTVELARERWPHVEVIGESSPRRRLAKLETIGRRAVALRSWAMRTRPDVALSHNSYAQIIAARRLGIPAVTAMDYEYQSLNPLAFRLATRVLVPETFPIGLLRRQGAQARKTIRYAGLKEELYIGDFEPDQAILRKIGLSARPTTVVVVRTPPSRAMYHPMANPLFDDALRTISRQDDVVCIALARHPEQVEAIEKLDLTNCIAANAAADSRSLMYAADVMIGAGGTMTREAALLGIPTWTAFAGKMPAVDVSLERQGMLRRLVDPPSQLAPLRPRARAPRPVPELRARAAAIECLLVDATLATCVGTAARESPVFVS